MRKPLSLFLIWTVFVFSFPANGLAQEKTDIAVLNLQGRGISSLEAETLTDYMRSELAETGTFGATEFGEIKQVLQEKGLEDTGCATDDCALEIGKLLGVSYVVFGSVGKQKDTYDLGCRMLNIKTGTLQKSVKRTYRGDVDGLVMTVQRIVWDIVGLTPPPGRFPHPEALGGPALKSIVGQSKYEIMLVFLFLAIMATFSRSEQGAPSPIEDVPPFPHVPSS